MVDRTKNVEDPEAAKTAIRDICTILIGEVLKKRVSWKMILFHGLRIANEAIRHVR